MYSISELENILLIDIETASIVPSYEELPARMKPLWDRKAKKYQRDPEAPDSVTLFKEKAGIHAEFARVVCISCGYIKFDADRKPQLTTKSYYGADEYQILKDCGDMLDKYAKGNARRTLCAHNGKEFDFPFLGRRYLIHGLALPNFLQIQGKKPWEISLLDTMELWKFGDYKAYTSLDLMTAVLGIPSPKDDIDGSQVGYVFWEEQDHERIMRYCEQDVKATAQVLLRMSRMDLLA